jgi:hypothetical protein
MKERPTIMSGESVRAILDGRKTVTRRVIKPQASPPPARFVYFGSGNLWIAESNSGKVGIFNPNHVKCPYGKIGDRLWVRETWAEAHYWTNDIDSETPIYRAFDDKTAIKKVVWKSPVTMPRWASRLTLEITDIRVERLQGITEEQAIAEGMYGDFMMAVGSFGNKHESVITQYHIVWNSLNAKHCYPWASNPWVWVLEFKVVK